MNQGREMKPTQEIDTFNPEEIRKLEQHERAVKSTLLRSLKAMTPEPEERTTGFEQYCQGGWDHGHVLFDRDRPRAWKIGWLGADERHEDFKTLKPIMERVGVWMMVVIMLDVFAKQARRQPDSYIVSEWAKRLAAAVQGPPLADQVHLVWAALALAARAATPGGWSQYE